MAQPKKIGRISALRDPKRKASPAKTQRGKKTITSVTSALPFTTSIVPNPADIKLPQAKISTDPKPDAPQKRLEACVGLSMKLRSGQSLGQSPDSNNCHSFSESSQSSLSTIRSPLRDPFTIPTVASNKTPPPRSQTLHPTKSLPPQKVSPLSGIRQNMPQTFYSSTESVTTAKPLPGNKRHAEDLMMNENKRNRTYETSPFSTSNAESDVFPMFSKGTVFISVSEEPKYEYQLHKAVLERSSTWFYNSFRGPAPEEPAIRKRDLQTEPMKTNIRFRFILEDAAELAGQVLVRKPLHKNRVLPADPISVTIIDLSDDSSDPINTPILQPSDTTAETSCQPKEEPEANHSNTHLLTPEKTPAEGVKEEVTEKEKNDPEIKTSQEAEEAAIRNLQEAEEARRERLKAYHNLFLCYYNQAPEITSQDINTTLSQALALVEVATLYDSIHIVRAHLGNILSQFGRSLYLAILKDPPKWLSLAEVLQSGPIFTEALIHIAGCAPHWPWPSPAASLPRHLKRVVCRKAYQLAFLRGEVDRTILLNNIKIDQVPISLSTTKDNFETWVTIQYFRDWFCGTINKYLGENKQHLCPYYRLMRKGGNAYLGLQETKKLLDTYQGIDFGQWKEVGEDLKLLKCFAQEKVEVLCKNNSMLDIDSLGIQYLTCTEVGARDFPWTWRRVPAEYSEDEGDEVYFWLE
ncbi:MAG: hypothetical protein M1829_000523 [Trizodia sp. TS-e1964]|nr:MAG: hypothetical protein M1829_000523 [Trizodia sp. TS-e1964]